MLLLKFLLFVLLVLFIIHFSFNLFQTHLPQYWSTFHYKLARHNSLQYLLYLCDRRIFLLSRISITKILLLAWQMQVLPFSFSHIGEKYYVKIKGKGHEPFKRKWTVHQETLEKRTCFRDSMKELVIEVRHRSDSSTKREISRPKRIPHSFCCILLKIVGVCSAFLFLLDSLHVCLYDVCLLYCRIPAASSLLNCWSVR